jgi:glycosyltransferase involved in cell wall biosynthesis
VLRILIVTAHFPPQNSIAAARPASWARYLSAQGHEVSVLTAARSGTLPIAECYERIEVQPPGVVLFMHADELIAKPLRAARTWPIDALQCLAARLLHWLRRDRGVLCSARMPDHHDPWIPRALHRIRGRRWDVVLTTHGPYACHVVGWWLRRRGHAARWAADFRDLWADNHIFPGLPPFSWIEPVLERILLHRADALTTVSEGLATRLGARHSRHVTVIRNGVDLEDIDALDPSPVWPADGLFRVVYTGTIYASGQDPSPLFRAIREMLEVGEPHIGRLRLVFAGKFQSDLERKLAKAGLAGIAELPGFVTRAQALRMQRDAGALLFLPFVSPVQDGILTGKLFEYLASGTPIISVGTARDPSTANLIEANGRGQDYGADTGEISAALRKLLSEPAGPRSVDRETLARVDRRAANAKLLALIEGL